MHSVLSKSAMIGALGSVLFPILAARAETAMDCLPPLPPAPVTDARALAAYRAEIGEEYATYFDDAQTYLRCLEAARAQVTREVDQVIADYQELGAVPED